jgi:hypothetical protein
MHAEAVRHDAMPSKQGLIQDEDHPVRCAECNVKYHLHYDSEAEASATFCSILADEIVTARHPDHSNIVVLDLAPLDRGQGRNARVAWSIWIPLAASLKKKSNVP